MHPLLTLLPVFLLLAASPARADVRTAEPEGVLEIARLVSQDADLGDTVGYAVDIDGDRMIVGAPSNDDFGSSTGSAYVFVRSDTGWVQEAKLTASNASPLDAFGIAVAIDGDTVLVGAFGDGLQGAASGTAYVFTRSGSTWTEEARFSGGDIGPGDRFAYSVALSGDTAVVGAIGGDAQGTNSGSAYVFVRSGTTWSEEAQLLPSLGGPSMQFGQDVAVDGDSVIVGSLGNADRAGAAHVFVRSGSGGNVWTEQQRFSEGEGLIDSRYGIRVAISEDLAAVSDDFAPDADARLGAVYLYRRTDGVWVEETALTSSAPKTDEEFGADVAIEGDLVLVGTRSGRSAGACELFFCPRRAQTRRHVARFTPIESTPQEHFGHQVAISGCRLAIGSPFLTGTSLDSGGAYVFLALETGFEPGRAFCVGIGCPCGNDDPSAGCVNSTGSGMRLEAEGTPSVTADDLRLVARNAPANDTGLFVLGDAPLPPISIGDGLLCTGGLFRFPARQVSPGGEFTLESPVLQTPADTFLAGRTRHFQAWTRDVRCGPPPAPCPTPCGGGSNLSNGYAVTMTP